jgi:CRISP-associated protein Cas1
VFRACLTQTSLAAALVRVAENQGCAGVDGETIAAFQRRAAANCRQLAHEVIADRYVPQALLRVWVDRPGKKPRGLAIPTVRDRVLQTSIAIGLTPLVEAELEDCSHAYRHGRGVRTAAERINALQRQGFRWVVDADIESFFDNIPHQSLLDRLAKVVPEPELLRLVKKWLEAPITEFTNEGEKSVQPLAGIAQGSPISPLLANLYLDTLDETLLDANHRLIRYADDFLVLTKSEAEAKEALELTQTVLERLSLKLNPIKTRIVNLDQGVDFLGWHFVRSIAMPKEWKELALPEVSGMIRAWPEENLAPALDAAKPLLSSDSSPLTDRLEASLAKDAVEESDSGEGQIEASESLEENELPPLAPLQRTLYLIDPKSELRTEGGRFVVEREQATILSVPAINVDQIMTFGPIQITAQALHLAGRQGCAVAYLSRLGRFYGRFEPSSDGFVTLQAGQFRASEKLSFAVEIAKSLVGSKLHNSAVVLVRLLRREPTSRADSKPTEIKALRLRLKPLDKIESVRGIEGNAARAYWNAFASCVPSEFGFVSRAYQPEPDIVNAMLSLGYGLLRHAVAGLIQARGLNAYLGIFHVPSSGHTALASDLMEPLRAYVVDSIVLKMLRGKEITLDHARTHAGEISLTHEGTKIFIRAFEVRLSTVIQHPQTGVLMDLRRIIDFDVLQLCKAFRANDPSLFNPTHFR